MDEYPNGRGQELNYRRKLNILFYCGDLTCILSFLPSLVWFVVDGLQNTHPDTV